MNDRSLIAAVLLLLVSGGVFGAAWIALPRDGKRVNDTWWSIPSYALMLKVDDEHTEGDRLVRVENATWPTELADVLFIGEVYFSEFQRVAPPGFGWLWGDWIMRIRCERGQWLLTGDWSAESLPADAAEQIQHMVAFDLNDGRYAEQEQRNPGTIDRMLGLTTPVLVDLETPRFSEPIPEFDTDVPMYRLWVVSALSAAGCVLVLLATASVGRWGVGWLIRQRRRKQRLCVGCGYDLRDLGRCPECGLNTI
ncbi:MAG: hypothetical protein AB8F26_02490 [Phycisphaerales bacterium]